MPARTSEDLSNDDLRLLGVALDRAESPLVIYGKNETLIYANAAARSCWPITIDAIESGMTRREAVALEIQASMPNITEQKLRYATDGILAGFESTEPTQIFLADGRLYKTTHHQIGDIAIVGMAIDITELHENKHALLKARESAEFRAEHDSLTSLPNRLKFHRIVEDKINGNEHEPFWLLMCDIDKFKLVNDVHGHEAGDQVILEFAGFMTSILGESATISRLGGDEFAILVCDDAKQKWDRHELKTAIERGQFETKVGDQILEIEFSCGAAQFPDNSMTYKDLLKCADLALLRSKRRGAGRIDFYDPHLGERHTQDLSLMTEFETALQNNQIIPYFQPVIDMESGEPTSIEALVRWEHKDRGLLTPKDFEKIFQDRRHSSRLSRYMLKSMTALMADWQGDKVRFPTMNLNVEASDLLDPAFMANLLTCATADNLSPACFGLEIAEDSISNVDNEMFLESLDGIRSLGFKIILDGFSSDSSSISHLDHLPITGLKLAKSCILKACSNGRTRTVLKGIIGLAQDLDLTTIAAGIEDEATLLEMKKIGCDAYQGYSFSRPLSPEDMKKFLVARSELKFAELNRRVA